MTLDNKVDTVVLELAEQAKRLEANGWQHLANDARQIAARILRRAKKRDEK